MDSEKIFINFNTIIHSRITTGLSHTYKSSGQLAAIGFLPYSMPFSLIMDKFSSLMDKQFHLTMLIKF